MGAIRLVLALMVACTHFWRPELPQALAMHAVFAVRAFFIISGFYMAMVIDDRYGERSPVDFYASRLLKILPIYWFVSAILFAAWIPLHGPGKFEAFAAPLTYWYRLDIHSLPWPIFLYIAAALGSLIGIDTGLWLSFDPVSGHLGLSSSSTPSAVSVMNLAAVPQAWTLGIELMFYLIAPFVVRRSLPVVVGLLVVSIALRIGTERMGMANWPFDRSFSSECSPIKASERFRWICHHPRFCARRRRHWPL